jgi:hypothetical protein
VEWNEWSKSGKRPTDIPSDPANVYRDDGWVSFPDWLGTTDEAAAAAKVRKANL